MEQCWYTLIMHKCGTRGRWVNWKYLFERLHIKQYFVYLSNNKPPVSLVMAWNLIWLSSKLITTFLTSLRWDKLKIENCSMLNLWPQVTGSYVIDLCQQTSVILKEIVKIDNYKTTMKRSKSQTLCMFPGMYYMADSRFTASQWETSLQSNAVSHWLGASLESALYYITACKKVQGGQKKCTLFSYYDHIDKGAFLGPPCKYICILHHSQTIIWLGLFKFTTEERTL